MAIKAINLHYYSAYDYQTWQSGDLPWGDPIVIVTWPFNPADLFGHVTN